MRIFTVIGLVSALVGCGGAEVNAESCKDICAQAAATPAVGGTAAADVKEAGPALSSFEQDLVGPLIDEVRKGVVPFDESGIGICKGERACDEYLGMKVGELPPGKYIVKAELQVPNVGDPGTWKVQFDTECTTTKTTANGETSSTSNYSRVYDVRFAGKDRGYRLMPLRTIESPTSGGTRSCNWKLIAPHPDGDKVYEGSWSTLSKD